MKRKDEASLGGARWLDVHDKLPKTIERYIRMTTNAFTKASIFALTIERSRGKWVLSYETRIGPGQRLAAGTPTEIGRGIYAFGAGYDVCKRWTRDKQRKPSARKVKTKKATGSLF